MLICQISEQEGINEKLKSKDLMTRIKQINNLKNRVQEIVNKEIIYV